MPPPVVVAVVGPPQVGKTTLIRSLIKRYTKQTLTEIRGTVTIVTGKNRRLTFIECENDMNAMIDIAKVCACVCVRVCVCARALACPCVSTCMYADFQLECFSYRWRFCSDDRWSIPLVLLVDTCRVALHHFQSSPR